MILFAKLRNRQQISFNQHKTLASLKVAVDEENIDMLVCVIGMVLPSSTWMSLIPL